MEDVRTNGRMTGVILSEWNWPWSYGVVLLVEGGYTWSTLLKTVMNILVAWKMKESVLHLGNF